MKVGRENEIQIKLQKMFYIIIFFKMKIKKKLILAVKSSI